MLAAVVLGPVELGDQQASPLLLGERNGCDQLGAIGLLTRLNFDELTPEWAAIFNSLLSLIPFVCPIRKPLSFSDPTKNRSCYI